MLRLLTFSILLFLVSCQSEPSTIDEVFSTMASHETRTEYIDMPCSSCDSVKFVGPHYKVYYKKDQKVRIVMPQKGQQP